MRKVNEILFECSLSGLGILNFQNEAVSGEEHFIKKLLPGYLNTGKSVAFDVGANLGDYTEMLHEAHQDMQIYAFEPNPKNFKKLATKVAKWGVTVDMRGMGSSDGSLKFYDRKDSDGASEHGSLYREAIEELHGVEAVETEVKITTLDNYCEENHIDHISLLKIDTEGHEYEVLKGAKKMLDAGKIDLIHLEFNEMNVISRVFFRDFAELLSDYRPYRLLPKGVIPMMRAPLHTELFAYQNLVFVNNRFLPDESMHRADKKR